MPKNSLSQNAIHTLVEIYQVHKKYANDKSSHPQILTLNHVFPNLEDREFMPSLAELNSQRMIRVFSDRRIILNDCAISYIEKQIKKGNIHLSNFET